MSCRTATVFTHRRADDTNAAMQTLFAAAQKAGVELRFDAQETEKHGLHASAGVVTDADAAAHPDVCLVLGGDGTILTALRRYSGTGVPVFAVNFGEVGFLATVDPDELGTAFERAFSGDFEVLQLPAIELEIAGATHVAVNDASIHRKVGERVAQLAYALGEDELGSVRCDGLVVATPAGSTGYNLANGGPVLAWGVEGFVVSFIAPHSLTARALVVAPADVLTVHNRSAEPVTVSADGRPAGELEPGAALRARFVPASADLAQVPGSTFYKRLRQKFGRLSA